MSWLYSIVFAGLLFSSAGQNTATANPESAVATPPAAAQDQTETFEQSYPLAANGRVSVSNVNGSIVIEAWDKAEVRLVATKIADSKETLAEVNIRVDARADYFSVETDYGDWNSSRDAGRGWKNRRLEVQFRLQVPRTAVLNEIQTVNGSVTVADFVNYTKISAVNGNVSATNLRGAANLSTVNGEVAADFDRLEAGGRISLSTVNGRVNLVIPSDANATVRADSLNGSISNEFGLPVRKGQYVGRDLYGRIGNGEVEIKLNSVNGGLSIGRKKDGKSVSPATNLLPQKKSGGDDWIDDTDNESAAVNAARVDREVARAVRQSQRQTAEAVKSASKAIAKVGPELDKIRIDNEKLQSAIQNGLKQQEFIWRFGDAVWPGPLIEKKRNSFSVKGTPKVTIDAAGCNVRVRGWDRSEVQYVVTEIARRRNREPVTVTETRKDPEIGLQVVNPNSERRPAADPEEFGRVRVDVFVPRKSNLRIVTDGEIRLEGLSGEMELKGEDEAIDIRETDGKISLTAGDGQVRVIGFNGDFDSQTANGDVYLEGNFRKLAATAGDGTIFLTLPGDANASIFSNTGVESEGLNITPGGGGKPWQIGRGGTKYNFTFGDGRLIVRNTTTIESY